MKGSRSTRVLGALLILIGAALLAFVGREYLAGRLAQRRAPDAGELRAAATPSASEVFPVEPSPTPRPVPVEGEFLGRLLIPEIDLDVAFFEGVSERVLRDGPGRMPSTALPGEDGGVRNCVLAGHRDQHFRRLGELTEGDRIRLLTSTGEREYAVVSRRVVGPRQVEVAGPTEKPRLTLLTCYPFRYVGKAPKRYVVAAEPVVEGETLAGTSGGTVETFAPEGVGPPQSSVRR